VTQTIAADLHDRLGAFEGRGHLEIVAEPVALTDPAPPALQTVCAGWRLALQPAAALVDRE
jgi:hypothetical protein